MWWILTFFYSLQLLNHTTQIYMEGTLDYITNVV